jgi:hypothetical protein
LFRRVPATRRGQQSRHEFIDDDVSKNVTRMFKLWAFRDLNILLSDLFLTN